MPTHWPGSLVDIDALHALARPARAARDRGRRAGDGVAVERTQHRRDRRPRHVQLPSEQEHDDDRGRRARRQRRRRGASASTRCAFTASPICPTARATSRFPAASSTCPTSTRGSASRSSRGCRSSSPRAARSSTATSSASRPIRRACCRRGRATTTASRGTCSRCCCRSTGLTITRKEFRDALDARGIGTGVSYEALHLCTLGRRYGYKEGDFPVTERIARETVTLPLHAAMTTDDVDRVCAASPPRRSCAPDS